MKEDMLMQFAKEVESTVKQLRRGFNVINDISNLKATPKNATEFVKSAHRSLADHGVDKVIRITGSSITTMQFRRTAKEVSRYEAIEVGSMEEALSLVQAS